MSVIVNEVRRATFFDSMVLMRISRQIADFPGVEEAGLFIGTPANKDILREAGILGPDGDKAESGDLILAVRASDNVASEAALVEARRLLDQPLTSGPSSSRVGSSRTIRAALHAMPNANLALISVPGPFAAAGGAESIALRAPRHDLFQQCTDQGGGSA
jgi:FdrA protein